MRNNKLREVLSVLLCAVLIINTGFCTFAAAKKNDKVAEIEAAMTELPGGETRQENIQETHNETIEQSECETVFDTVHEESEPYSETAQETAVSEETIRETLESETGESVLPEIEEVLMSPELEALKLQLDQIKALGINTSDYYGSFEGINVPENRRMICETAAAYKEMESVMEFVEALEEGVHGFTLDDRILLDGCVDILYRCLENGGIVLYDNETGLPVVGYPNTENIEHELPNPFLRSVNPSYNGDQTITKQINCGSGSSTITINNGASITVDLRSNENGDAGIRIPSNGSLTITGNGILTVYGSEASNSGDNGGGAGIGGNAGESSGSLIIEDGISVISNGGSASHTDVGAGAGIGGGGGGNTKAGGNNGTVLILSGAVVEANGGRSLGKSTSGGASGGAGIGGGGGGNGAAGGYGGNIEIHGTVTANGGSCTYKEASGGAGIGGGGGGASPGPGGNSGIIVIGSSGGGTVPWVQSLGGGGGAGIGGGGSGNGNKSSNTYGGHGTTINIYSGTVYAKGSVTGEGNSNVSHGGSGIGGGGFTTNSNRGSNGGDIVIGSAADVTAIGGASHNVSGNGDRGLCGSGIGVAGENGKMPKTSSGTLAIYQGASVKAYSRGELVTPQDDVSTSGHNQGDAIGTNSDTSHGEHLAIDFGRGNNCLYFQFVQKDNDIIPIKTAIAKMVSNMKIQVPQPTCLCRLFIMWEPAAHIRSVHRAAPPANGLTEAPRLRGMHPTLLRWGIMKQPLVSLPVQRYKILIILLLRKPPGRYARLVSGITVIRMELSRTGLLLLIIR